MRLGTLLAAACAAAFAGAHASAADQVCQMVKIGELPVEIDHGALVVEANINGHPVKMIVDSGSAATLLFRATATDLGLKINPSIDVQLTGVGGDVEVGSVHLGELRLGDLVARDFDMAVTDTRSLGGHQGLLGQGFVLKADIEFDLPEGKVRLFRPKSCTGDQVVYWQKDYSEARLESHAGDKVINLMVQVNGNPILATLDSGATESTVAVEAAARFGVSPTSAGMAKDGKAEGIGKKIVQDYVGIFPTFTIGDETIHNANLHVSKLFNDYKPTETGSRIPIAHATIPEMLLGLDFLKSHRVYVSFQQRKVYMSYLGGPVFKVPDRTPAS